MYQESPSIHISVSLTKPHVELTHVCATLVGVYRHMFQIEAEKNGKMERFSIQYGEIIAGIIRIEEL